jgi:mRNA-degrading endonuclease toxin of MazEF toxin-antitoxin module
MDRGELWWAAFPSKDKPHLMLILSPDARHTWRDRVTAALVTSQARGIPRVEVQLTPLDDGVREYCVIKLDELATIRKRLMTGRQTTLRESKMREVEMKLHRALGMGLPCPYAELEILDDVFPDEGSPP